MLLSIPTIVLRFHSFVSIDQLGISRAVLFKRLCKSTAYICIKYMQRMTINEQPASQPISQLTKGKLVVKGKLKLTHSLLASYCVVLVCAFSRRVLDATLQLPARETAGCWCEFIWGLKSPSSLWVTQHKSGGVGTILVHEPLSL